MLHSMKLNPEPFNMIKLGQKTIELRLNDGKRKKINVEDTIEFVNQITSEKILTKVINIYIFKSFDELYNNLDLYRCGYTKENINTATPSDMEKYYSAEKQNKYGVLGIEVELIKY